MRPTEHGFVGPLAGELEEYIRFKASMGRHGATRVRVLRSFDRHCLEHGAVRLERGVVERWIAHRIDANPGGCRSWFSYIRDFGRWMRLAHDPDAYVLSDQWKAGSPRPTPYLLTDREAALFLRAAGTLESPSPWAWQSRAFFMLMACCGLRTREVRRLAVGHVDHKARSIDVVDSKAGRSRRLPVGDEVRRRTAGMRPTVPRTLRRRPSRVLRHLHRQSGLPGHARRGVPPRLDAGRARVATSRQTAQAL